MSFLFFSFFLLVFRAMTLPISSKMGTRGPKIKKLVVLGKCKFCSLRFIRRVEQAGVQMLSTPDAHAEEIKNEMKDYLGF